MSYKVVDEEFKVVGLKGIGDFVNFGNEVPSLAKQLLSRSNEIENPTIEEIALFEPKKDETHTSGHYYVGLTMNEKLEAVPAGMDYIEINSRFATTRGAIADIKELHSSLLIWAEGQGYHKDSDAYIIETYHPLAGGGEEVQIYLPIQM